MKYIDTDKLNWLDNYGFVIAKMIQEDGSYAESQLLRLAFKEDGTVALCEEYLASKFEYKLRDYYNKLIKNNKKVDMNIMETLNGLTISELKSLKPSYYNLAIDAKIAELQKINKIRKKRELTEDEKQDAIIKKALKVGLRFNEKLRKKEEKDAAKAKRNTETTTEADDRSRDI